MAVAVEQRPQPVAQGVRFEPIVEARNLDRTYDTGKVESSFVALTSIVVGTGLALVVAFNVISDSRRTPSWAGMSFEVPWLTLGVIFLVVYAVALATTYAPAVRASRIYPAEALRYQ